MAVSEAPGMELSWLFTQGIEWGVEWRQTWDYIGRIGMHCQ